MSFHAGVRIGSASNQYSSRGATDCGISPVSGQADDSFNGPRETAVSLNHGRRSGWHRFSRDTSNNSSCRAVRRKSQVRFASLRGGVARDSQLVPTEPGCPRHTETMHKTINLRRAITHRSKWQRNRCAVRADKGEIRGACSLLGVISGSPSARGAL